MSEYWIEVKGHPRYMVSTLGKVKSLDYRGTGKERICKLSVTGNGYLQIYIDGEYIKVHRIVLESFIPNPEKKPCVEHINTDKKDCRLENLRWVSHKENSNNPLTLKHMSESNKGKNIPMLGKLGADCPNSIPIVQLTKDGVFVKKWPAAMEVQRELGIYQSSIVSCCRGRIKSAGGYKWVYAKNFTRTKKISEIKPLF